MLSHLPVALQGPAVDLLAAEHPQLQQMLSVAYHNGREAAYNDARQTVDGAVAQALRDREKLRFIYENVSDEAKAEIDLLLTKFNNKNN